MTKYTLPKSRWYPWEALGWAFLFDIFISVAQLICGVRGWATGYAPISPEEVLWNFPAIALVLFLLLYAFQLIDGKTPIFRIPLGTGKAYWPK